jgi:Ring finger domain
MENRTAALPSSFRVTQSSSFRINVDSSDDDRESNRSFCGAQLPNCAICLDRFKFDENICSAQNKDCTHEYHLECIFPWLLKSQDCPCCRRDYLTIESDNCGQSSGTTDAVPTTSSCS